MACYKIGGCGAYEMYSCSECPASKPEYLNRNNKLKDVTGLYPKYTVTNNQTGLEVYDCFVLKPMSDESARLALLYYADICGNEALKTDIKAWLGNT